jgi:hypothetical protein
LTEPSISRDVLEDSTDCDLDATKVGNMTILLAGATKALEMVVMIGEEDRWSCCILAEERESCLF